MFQKEKLKKGSKAIIDKLIIVLVLTGRIIKDSHPYARGMHINCEFASIECRNQFIPKTKRIEFNLEVTFLYIKPNVTIRHFGWYYMLYYVRKEI